MQERYQRERELGAGAMGVVERHHDHMLGRAVAFKRPRREGSARFIDEARVLAGLEHPGIPALYALTPLDDGTPGFSMEPLVGRTLDVVLAEVVADAARAPRAALRRAVTLLRDVANIAGFAHTHRADGPVVHRDLKPANVLAGPRDEVWVVDWGLAGQDTQGVAGTPAWMAPEQARGERVGPTADVWALGVMLSDAVLGSGHDPPGGERNDEVPAELRALIAACTALDPADRPPNGLVVAAALDAWLDGSSARARASELVRRAEEEAKIAQLRRAAAWARWREVLVMEPRPAEAGPVEGRTPGLPDPTKERSLVSAEAELAEAALAVERALELGREALGLDPDLPEARRFLANYHRDQASPAEARFEPAGAHLAAVEVWDDGELAVWRRGRGRLRLDSSPSGAEVWVEPGRGVGLARRLGETPLDVPLDMGSYRVRVVGAGREVVVPVRIDRLATWDAGVVDLTLRPPAGFIWVEGGPFLRGDPLVLAVCEGFAIAELPVSNAEYDRFLAALPADEAARRAALPGAPELPVCGVRPADAVAYVGWLAAGRGLDGPLPELTLPTAMQWEKAARGVDGRLFPWGDEADPARANVVGGPAATLLPVEACPGDVSVYGVRGLAGGVRDFCWLDDSCSRVVSKGGAWSLAMERARASIETGAILDSPGPSSGFRLAWRPRGPDPSAAAPEGRTPGGGLG